MAAVSIHPEFQARNLANDVAVLFMETEVSCDWWRAAVLTSDWWRAAMLTSDWPQFRLDWNVDTVCLPQPGESFDGRSCFATGWGKDEFGDAGEFQVISRDIYRDYDIYCEYLDISTVDTWRYLK